MNQKKHWNKIAPAYNEEIFDVFKSDKNKVLNKFFKRYANPNHHALDFGCGIGKAFRYLSPRFRKITAMDISDNCLREARQTSFSNIVLQQADLSDPKVGLPKVEFVFCCNVIMLPEPEKNILMLRNVNRALRKGGSAVIILPAMESYLFSAWRLIDWNKREGTLPEKIDPDELSGFQVSKTDLLQGLLKINGVQTKHYSEPELQVIFPASGLTIMSINKVEYTWHSEFSEPPRWMKAPYPWDWLVECRKVN
ncbi:MAG: class I SAM-dependent methyltransferase [Cyclobacteriaceae bacterium]